MSDGQRSGRSTGRVSCKSTELKRCSMIEMRWNKYKVSLASSVWTQIRRPSSEIKFRVVELKTPRFYTATGLLLLLSLFLLCYHGVVERNRISSLQSHEKALEKKCCLPGVFRDSGDTPANLLCELNGHLMPCTSCCYGKWVIIIMVIIIILYNISAWSVNWRTSKLELEWLARTAVRQRADQSDGRPLNTHTLNIRLANMDRVL